MKIFDLFKKRNDGSERCVPNANMNDAFEETTVKESDKKYYQPDSYYTSKIYEGTPFEKTVVTFEERKKTCIPSRRGLYVAEILLLEYCSYGTYPRPQNGYPGFWWFEYGIRDVGLALKDLENRGYIKYASVKDSINQLKIPQLKELLAKYGMPKTGKKADLCERVALYVSENDLCMAGVEPKYELTEIGQQELDENAYVAYMHKYPRKTVSNPKFGTEFNVWSINRSLGKDDKSNWKVIVEKQEQDFENETSKNNDTFMKELKKIDLEGYKLLKSQDQQIAAVQAADAKYSDDKDLNSYIDFWEMVWANGGLKFEGTGWYFKLPDLYIKAKRYDDALAFVINLKNTKPTYAYKANVYIDKIESLKAKQKTKKSK